VRAETANDAGLLQQLAEPFGTGFGAHARSVSLSCYFYRGEFLK
jgi:hypothetical protein